MTDKTEREKGTMKINRSACTEKPTLSTKDIMETGREIYLAAMKGILDETPTVANYEILAKEFHILLRTMQALQSWSEEHKDLDMLDHGSRK